MKKTGLFFGSFNPVHVGHLIMAETFLERASLDEVWFVVSPQNPLKPASELAPEKHRLEMTRLAIEGNDRFHLCDLEFNLPRPSYTSDTLRNLFSLFPGNTFHMLIGDDILATLPQWKDYSYILNTLTVYVFPRGFESSSIPKELAAYTFHRLEAPRSEISSTGVRQLIRSGASARYMIPDAVRTYITHHKLYG